MHPRHLLAAVLVLGSALLAQDSRPTSRPTDRERRVRAPFTGEDLPGRDVTRGVAWTPMTSAPYSRPEAMKNPVTGGDLVIGLAGPGGARAYPIKMLGGPQREIVNDRLGSLRYAVNW